MKNNLKQATIFLLITNFNLSLSAQQTFSYEFTNDNMEILIKPTPIVDEYLAPNYTSITKPLVAQPFANNAECFNIASEVHSSAGNITNVFFGGDDKISTMVAINQTFNKVDFPIMMESNFYSEENTGSNFGEYDEFYFWIGDAKAPYYCAATTARPLYDKSKEGLLVGSVPSTSLIFNSLDNKTTGTNIYNSKNLFFTTKNWSNHKVLFDEIDNKLAIIGYWIDGNCIINSLENEFYFAESSPWLDNFRLGVCIDDLGKDFIIRTKYNYFDIVNPNTICVSDCIDFKLNFNEILCTENSNISWKLIGSSNPEVNQSNAEDICYEISGLFKIKLDLNGVNIFNDSIIVNDNHQIMSNVFMCSGESITIGGETYDKPGIYFQKIISDTGCDTILTIEVLERSIYSDFEYTYDKCKKELLLISESDGKLLVKQDGNIKGEYHKDTIPLPFGKYELTHIINDSTNCRIETSKTIDLIETPEIDDILLPNIMILDKFTNNQFCGSNLIANNFTFISLQIFDRFGNIVYKSSQSSDCWDGKLNGNNCEQGVYTYLLKVQENYCSNNVFLKSGDITVIR